MDRKQLTENLQRMRKLAVPEEGVYAIAPLDVSGMPSVLSSVLRVFRAIQFDRGRRPSKRYDPDFDKLNHVLSDSPTTIASKMGADWQSYCHHAIVQLGVCNFRCSYCYVDFRFLTGKDVLRVSAEDILQQFLARRREMKAQGTDLNVLRVSGGEPFLAPDLTLQLLRRVEEEGLQDEICIKTETNLSPLVPDDGVCAASRWADLSEFSKYRNFIVHPTFHGVSTESLARVGAAKWESFDMMLDAVRTMLRYKIDFYPSIGANTVKPAEASEFFEALTSIHPQLPLRVAVRKFDFNYNAPAQRGAEKRMPDIYDHRETVLAWDSLLQARYGVGYGEVPRHDIALN